ncbi:MAG TPA: hypothetical protein VL122_13385 [Nitrospirota bacterium]|nr:hypothetical protein [Nitrospirota bacterium]
MALHGLKQNLIVKKVNKYGPLGRAKCQVNGFLLPLKVGTGFAVATRLITSIKEATKCRTMPQRKKPDNIAGMQARVIERLLYGDTITAATKFAGISRTFIDGKKTIGIPNLT